MALGKLKTKDKLHSIGVTLDNLCPLYVKQRKMFNTSTSIAPSVKKCLDCIENWVGIRVKSIAKMDFRKHKLKRIQHIMSAIYTSTIYAIWKCRNTAVWETLIQDPHSVTLKIREEIELRLRVLHIPNSVLDTAPTV